MAVQNVPLLTFNGGEVGPDTLNRVDLEGYGKFSGQMENWLPLSQGPMTVRPPWLYQVGVPQNEAAWIYSFSYNVDQSFLLLFNDEELRILQDGGIISRASVATTIANSDFSALTSWTDIDDGVGASTQSVGNELRLESNDSDLAGREQAIAIAGADLSVTHGLRVVVTRGPVYISIGTSSGVANILAETELATGTHSIAFVPSVATVYLRVYSRSSRPKYVDSISIEAAGDMVLPTPIQTASFPHMRFSQSADVLYLTYDDGPIQRLERRANDSWSFVTHEVDDGPFEIENTNIVFTLTPGAVSGETTLTASQPLFSTGHVGGIFQATHTGQRASSSLASANVFTDSIRVIGIDTDRAVNVTITGTFVATVTLQKSVGNDTDWDDVATYTGATSVVVNDGLDNQVIYYRIGIKSGDYTSGTAVCTITTPSGITTGICRVVEYTSETVVSIDVIEPFAKTDATADWAEGSWSGAQIWPDAVALFDGRLFVGGLNKIWASVSDNFSSFELNETDAGGISRLMASGSINPLKWFLPLARLLIGTEGSEHTLRSSTFDEPLTASNNALRPISTRGVANVTPCTVDTVGFYVDRTRFRLMALSYDVDLQDYRPRWIMRLHRRLGAPGIKQIAVARFPDTRIFCIREDGEMIVLLFNNEEDVIAFSRMTTDGAFENVAVLPAQPGDEEDSVYAIVKRTVNGSDVRFIEKLGAIEFETAEDAFTGDAGVLYDDVAATTIPGFDHLIGEELVVWADGAQQANKTVAADGTIELDTAAAYVFAGLPFNARYTSGKLDYAARGGTALSQQKRITNLSIGYYNSIVGAIRHGYDFAETMDQLDDRVIALDYDEGPGIYTGETPMIVTPSDFNRDTRLRIEVSAPCRATISYVVATVLTNEKLG